MTGAYTEQMEKFDEFITQLKNQLKDNSIVNYDFKEEWKEGLYEKLKDLSPWQKMCFYQQKIYSMKIDCDVSLKSIIIFALAFPHVSRTKAKISSQNDGPYKYRIILPEHKGIIAEYRGDTMNSYNTTINEYLRLYGDDFNNPKILNIKENGKELRAAPNYKKWEDCILDNYEHFESRLPKEGMKYIKMSHTLGNFIPVPLGKSATAPTKSLPDRRAQFNGPRGIGKTKDYWDLALLNIYNWYKDKNDSHLKSIVGAEGNRKLTEEWLGVFKDDGNKPSWDVFVKKNFLQDFIEKDSNGVYGKPKELWDNHFKDSTDKNKAYVLPRDKADFIQFFCRSSEWIEARGHRIAKEVEKSLSNKEILSDLEIMVKNGLK